MLAASSGRQPRPTRSRIGVSRPRRRRSRHTRRRLLTDVVMPGASGQDLTQLLGLQRPDLRVMYMSSFAIIKGRQQFAETENGLELGVPIVLKPFTSQRLMEKVQEVLAAKAPSPFDHAPDPWRNV